MPTLSKRRDLIKAKQADIHHKIVWELESRFEYFMSQSPLIYTVSILSNFRENFRTSVRHFVLNLGREVPESAITESVKAINKVNLLR